MLVKPLERPDLRDPQKKANRLLQLAKDYGKDIAHTGPIYSGYKVDGNKAIVSFEKKMDDEFET